MERAVLVGLVAAVVLLSGCAQIAELPGKVASGVTGEITEQKTAEISRGIIDGVATGGGQPPEVTDAAFECENDNSVQSRGYVYLMGFAEGEEDKISHAEQERLMLEDPKAVFVELYAQNPDLHIGEIGEEFIAYMDGLLGEYNVEELVIFGSSAGGVTSSYSISRLNFSGPVALHTLASPLRGYELTGFREQFIGDRTGFLRDIAIGFEPFEKPGDNVKVYHHKTVTDSVLKDYCGDYADFCEPLKIQNNNIEGGKEFYYPEHDHITIMLGVVEDVLSCYK